MHAIRNFEFETLVNAIASERFRGSATEDLDYRILAFFFFFKTVHKMNHVAHRRSELPPNKRSRALESQFIGQVGEGRGVRQTPFPRESCSETLLLRHSSWLGYQKAGLSGLGRPTERGLARARVRRACSETAARNSADRSFASNQNSLI